MPKQPPNLMSQQVSMLYNLDVLVLADGICISLMIDAPNHHDPRPLGEAL